MTASFRWAVLGLTLILAACASGPGSGKADASPEAAIERRAVERWNHIISGQYNQAYQYLTPGYRATRTPERYAVAAAVSAVKRTGIQWQGVTCEHPDVCEAVLILFYTFSTPSAGDIPGFTEIREKWLRTGSQWYHLPIE